MRKTLLLSNNYEPLGFINTRKAINLICRERVDILSNWEDEISSASLSYKIPSLLRLKNQITRRHFTIAFSRRAILKRDNNTCQYCGIKLTGAEITIDHVIPKCAPHYGTTSFLNCVCCCKPCNEWKGNRLLSQISLKLLKKPVIPDTIWISYMSDINESGWHEDWDPYIKNLF